MQLTKEQLVSKGVSHTFDGKEVYWQIDSLKEKYDGVEFHESDLVKIAVDDKMQDFIRIRDVFGDVSEKEVKEEPIAKNPKKASKKKNSQLKS